MFSGWEWPQWTMAVAFALVFIGHATKDGELRDDRYDVKGVLIVYAIIAFVLHAGGFW